MKQQSDKSLTKKHSYYKNEEIQEDFDQKRISNKFNHIIDYKNNKNVIYFKNCKQFKSSVYSIDSKHTSFNYDSNSFNFNNISNTCKPIKKLPSHKDIARLDSDIKDTEINLKEFSTNKTSKMDRSDLNRVLDNVSLYII